MAKPIILFKIKRDIWSSLSSMQLAQIRTQLSDNIGDEYNFFILPSITIDDCYDIQVFYEKDFDQIKYDELKQMIEKELNLFNGK